MKDRMVYLVNNGGSYSDYGIEAAFSDEKVAEAVAKRIGGGVEGYTLYDADPGQYVVYVVEYDARIERTAEVVDRQFLRNAWESDAYFTGRMVRGIGIGNYGPRFYRRWGRDRDAVRKSFADYHAQMQAPR